MPDPIKETPRGKELEINLVQLKAMIDNSIAFRDAFTGSGSFNSIDDVAWYCYNNANAMIMLGATIYNVLGKLAARGFFDDNGTELLNEVLKEIGNQ